jgi:hypothetical protein
MRAVEFVTKLKNNKIIIPDDLQEELKGLVKKMPG